MKIISVVLLLLLFLSALYFHPISVFAKANTPKYEVLNFDVVTGPSALIKVIINWAFKFAGVFAFAMIVFAGFEYTTSGGNTSKQKDAQEKIIGAIVGIILLFSFYIILNTINPDILKEPSEPSSTSETPEEATPEEEIQPQQIGNFVLIGPNSDEYKDIPLSSELLSPPYNGIVYIDKATAGQLAILAQQEGLGDWVVTETCIEIIGGTYCKTTLEDQDSTHISDCHTLGTCVDVGYGGNPGSEITDAFINAANQAGFDVLNEYTCPQYGSGLHVEQGALNCLYKDSKCWSCASS
jgi:hypothetical protein